jgi:hypothetical protein
VRPLARLCHFIVLICGSDVIELDGVCSALSLSKEVTDPFPQVEHDPMPFQNADVYAGVCIFPRSLGRKLMNCSAAHFDRPERKPDR